MQNNSPLFSNQLDEKTSGGFLLTAATITAVAISALASFQFFATYANGLVSGIIPTPLAGVAAGVVGVVLLEGFALLWQRLLHSDADSKQQLTIAHTGYIVSLVASVSVTMPFFIMLMYGELKRIRKALERTAANPTWSKEELETMFGQRN